MMCTELLYLYMCVCVCMCTYICIHLSNCALFGECIFEKKITFIFPKQINEVFI